MGLFGPPQNDDEDWYQTSPTSSISSSSSTEHINSIEEYEDYMEYYSPKQKALAIVPKPFAILSLIGSSYIVYHILHNEKRRRAVQYQILLGLSLSDIMFSIAVSKLRSNL